MADIDKNIDSVLELLLKRSDLEKENVLKLSKDVTTLEETIKEDTKKSYTLVKDSLTDLKDTIRSNNEKIENEDWNKVFEKANIKHKYFNTLLSIKNEFLNFSIDSNDDLLFNFDLYNNEKSELIRSIYSLIESRENISSTFYTNITNIIYNSIFKYHEILIKYQSIYSEYFFDIERRIKDLSKIYLDLFDSHHKEIQDISLKYQEKRDSITSLLPHFEDFLSDDNNDIKEAIDNALTRSIEVLLNDYVLKKETLFSELKAKADNLILHIESNLLKTYSSSFNFELSKKELIETLIINTPKEKRDRISSLIMKISSSINIDEFENTVTEIYKNMFDEVYTEYLEKEKELEKEYIEISERLNASRYLEYFLTIKDKDAAFLENALTIENVELSISDSYYNSIRDKIDKYFEYSLNEIKVISSLEKIKVLFNFNKNLITSSLNKEIKDVLLELKRDITIEYETIKYNERYNEYIISNMIKDDRLLVASLNYKMNYLRYNRIYFTKKFITKLAYELYKENYNMDTLDVKMKLDTLVSKYSSMLKTFDTLYNTQKELMERSKVRNELLNLSNYKYAYSLLEHRLLISDSLLEASKSEYNLRISILDDIRSSFKNHSDMEISRIVSIYMDDIKEITYLRETEIKSIQSEIKSLNPNDDKRIYNDKILKINNKYDLIMKKLQEMLQNDPVVFENLSENETLDKVTVEFINDAQIIRNESLKESLKSIQKSHESFDRLISSLDVQKIDYDLVLNNYKNLYLSEKKKIEDKLNKESSEYIKLLDEYNKQFNLDYYYKEFNEIDKEQINTNKELYNSYIAELEKIEKTQKISPYYEEILSSNSDNIIENIKNDYENNLNKSTDDFFTNKEKLLSDRVNSTRKIDDGTIEESNLIMKNSLKLKDEYKNVLKDLKSNEKETIMSLKRILKSVRKTYSFELGAIKDNYESRLKTLLKELNKKYKNIDIYTLKGDK